MFNLYALLGIGAVVVALGGYGAYEYQRAEASNARAEQAESRAAALTQTLKESEEANEALRVAAEVLDATLVQRDRRGAALEQSKKDTDAKYAEIRAKLAEADRACLARDLPDAIAERLR